MLTKGTEREERERPGGRTSRRPVTDRFRDHEVAIERGRSRCADDLEDLLVAAFENLRAPEPAPALDARVEGVIAAMCSLHRRMPAIPYWIACRGLRFAVGATCQWASLTLEQALVDGQPVEWLVQPTRPALVAIGARRRPVRGAR